MAEGALVDPAPPLPATPIDTAIPRGTDKQAMVVSRTVGGIVSYTRWPADRPAIRLCTAGVTLHTSRFSEVARAAGRPVSLRAVFPGGSTADCDALYLGSMRSEDRARMIAGLAGRSVLSIAEADPACRSGAMFCLDVRPASLSFRLSIDAISRSTLHIDPRVLRIVGGVAP